MENGVASGLSEIQVGEKSKAGFRQYLGEREFVSATSRALPKTV